MPARSHQAPALDAGGRARWVGVLDPGRATFDELVPLPRGTTYNAYLLRGSEGDALVDAVEPEHLDELRARLEAAGPLRLRYVVSQHAEQDHSGSLGRVLREFPEATLLCTPKARDLLLLHVEGLEPERIRTVADGETVSLGDLELQFRHAPWVHWPETLFTWVPALRLLLTGDFLGSHLSFEPDRPWASAYPAVLDEALRYYATIIAPYAAQAASALELAASLEPAVVAPSHGPIWDRPAHVIGAYRVWTRPAPGRRVVLAYTSMHGSTRRMASLLAGALEDRGVEVRSFDLAQSDVGELAGALLGAGALLLGSPTVVGQPHPQLATLLAYLRILKPPVPVLGFFGSYGWGTRVAQQVAETLKPLRARWLEPVLAKGLPGDDARGELDRLAAEVEAGLPEPEEDFPAPEEVSP